MKKRTITVTTGHGTITRTTARDYAFVVVARGEHPAVVTNRHTNLIAWNVDAARYVRAQINGTEPNRLNKSIETLTADLASYEQTIANADALLAEALRAAEADLVAPYHQMGAWSSRLDLARKEYDRQRTYYRDVRIFEVATGREVLASLATVTK